MAVTKVNYSLPIPSDSSMPTSMDDISAYVLYLATFLAEKLGLVVRSDLAVTNPDYAPYSHVEFLAESANDFPVICVYNTNVESTSYRGYCYNIGMCGYSGNTHRILITGNASYNSDVLSADNYSNMWFSFSDNTARDWYLQVIDFPDGRKMATVKCYYKSGGQIASEFDGTAFIKMPIVIAGQRRTTWVYVGKARYNISYLEEFEQIVNTDGSINSSEFSYIPCDNRPYMYGLSDGTRTREFALDYDMWVSSNVVIPNMAIVSNRGHVGVGRSVLMGEKEYVIAYAFANDRYSAYAIPAEVS